MGQGSRIGATSGHRRHRKSRASVLVTRQRFHRVCRRSGTQEGFRRGRSFHTGLPNARCFRGWILEPRRGLDSLQSRPIVRGGEIYEVPARGGTPNLLISPEPEAALSSPLFLPRAGSRALSVTKQTILDTGRRETLGPGSNPVYSPAAISSIRTSRLSTRRARPFRWTL